MARPTSIATFWAWGVGGMLSGLFSGGFPANASPPRTAIVQESGGGSKLAVLIAAVIVAAFLDLGTRALVLCAGSGAGRAAAVCGDAHLPPGPDAADRCGRAWPSFCFSLVTALAIVLRPIEIRGRGRHCALAAAWRVDHHPDTRGHIRVDPRHYHLVAQESQTQRRDPARPGGGGIPGAVVFP